MSRYPERDFILRRMGYQTYNGYLRSKFWKELRERFFKARGRKCRTCPGDATQIHHVYYTSANLRGETFDGMDGICSHCHRTLETKSRSKRRSADDVRKIHLSRLQSVSRSEKHPVTRPKKLTKKQRKHQKMLAKQEAAARKARIATMKLGERVREATGLSREEMSEVGQFLRNTS
jgi:hypothetical protein